MTYILIAVLLETGGVYVERTGLTIQQCAGYAEMLELDSKDLEESIGGVQYLCIAGVANDEK